MGGRWKVRYCAGLGPWWAFQPGHMSWETLRLFGTHAEAVDYADRMARGAS